MRRKAKGAHLCLCSKCASFFYNSKKHRIYRVDMLQVITDECLFCRCSRGYDYLLEDLPIKRTFGRRKIGGRHG